MYKFLFIFSSVLFIASLALFIKNVIGEFTWLTFLVSVLGIIGAGLSFWNWKVLRTYY